MNEDRLIHLLAEASDLAPSAALRRRVADLRPQSRRPLPFFALSGAAAGLAAVAFLALPRSVSAADLLGKSGRAVATSHSWSTQEECWINGEWRRSLTVLHAPGWELCRWPDGRFQLQKPGELYRRFDPQGAIRKTRARMTDRIRTLSNDPTPDGFALLLRSLNPQSPPKDVTLALGSTQEVAGRRVREVTVSQVSAQGRTRFLVDEATDLPIRIDTDRRIGGRWQPFWRSWCTFPGSAGGNEAFVAPLRSARIVDVDAETKRWERRFAAVRRTLRPPHGEPLELRDLRTLPNGDVIVLYTGPQRTLSELEGPGGESYALAPLRLGNGLYPDRRHPLRALHFVPLRSDRPTAGPLRLRLFWRKKPNGVFRIDAPVQKEPAPPWIEAVDTWDFNVVPNDVRLKARIRALADQWLDAQGRPLRGAASRDDSVPLSAFGVMSFAGPLEGSRHDPKAAGEAAALLRGLLEGRVRRNEDPEASWSVPLLTELERWAKEN